MHRAGVEPAQHECEWVTATKARQCPADACSLVARVGIEPTVIRQGLSLAALPVCVPCQTSPMGFEPTTSTLTGWRALLTAPRGQTSVARVGVEPTASFGLSKGGLPVAYRADTYQFRRLESNQRQRVQSPMSYRLDDSGSVNPCARSSCPVRGEGVEPSRAASKTAGLPLADPRITAAAGIEPAIFSLTGSRLTTRPHRKISQDGGI